MMEKILIFITFLGPLIFFHELGHFLFARFFGIRVEVFSIGFGPKLLGWKWKDTLFTISLIPLGGYVKMFGDDPMGKDKITPEERKFAFNHQGKWARFCVAFGGPLANFILAFFLFVGLSLMGEKYPKLNLGPVSAQSTPILFESGLRIGDEILSINAMKAQDLPIDVVDDLDIIKTIEYLPFLSKIPKHITLLKECTGKQLKTELMKAAPFFRKPLVVDYKGNTYYLSSPGVLQDIQKYSLEYYASQKLSDLKQLIFYRTKLDDQTQEYAIDPSRKVEIDVHTSKDIETLDQFLFSHQYFPIDLLIKQVMPESPAAKSNLQEGDIIVDLNDKPVASFEQLRERLQILKENESIKLGYFRNAQKYFVNLVPQIKMIEGQKLVQIGIFSNAQYKTFEFNDANPIGIIPAIEKGMEKTWESTVSIFMGLVKLFSNQVSFKHIGGPLSIGKVASESFNIGIGMFLKLMAMISINLGVINLFPIPVLDGGHILFILLEILNKGPLSQKKIEMAHQFGMSLLFLLIFVSLFNDISRLM